MRKIAIYTGSRADACPLDSLKRLLGSYLPITTDGLFGHESYVREQLEGARPDILVILGDRYESLVVASVAALLAIPICHIHGGEETEGAVDNAFRHAITKLSYYHFAIHEDFAKRIIQMGEHPESVFVTGAPGIDQYVDSAWHAPVRELFDVKRPMALVCLHPETLGNDANNIKAVVGALSEHAIATRLVSTGNADLGNERIVKFWRSLGAEPKSYSNGDWATLMMHADFLIGNSSCFIIEGMTLGKKVINIGDRQKGRYESAVKHFASNPYAYGKPGEVSPKIAELLLTLPIPEKPRKAFHDFTH